MSYRWRNSRKRRARTALKISFPISGGNVYKMQFWETRILALDVFAIAVGVGVEVVHSVATAVFVPSDLWATGFLRL
jgi:hypothetical protein